MHLCEIEALAVGQDACGPSPVAEGPRRGVEFAVSAKGSYPPMAASGLTVADKRTPSSDRRCV